MGQNQTLTRTQIVKMRGQKTTHFLNPRAKRVTKPLGDLGGLQHLGFHADSVAGWIGRVRIS